MNPEPHWWKEGVIYQIYPRSFHDANGDGIGDLEGIISKLDYLEWLGIDAIWLCPIFRSPMRDFGYDVSDHCAIDPTFGTIDDVDALTNAAHARNIRLLLDYVPNHTSSDHPWFQASRRSRDDPKRNWYWWRDPKPDGTPPNNWQSHFLGPAWTLDHHTGQYYLHSFLPSQPDLAWHNPDVVAAMHDVLRFWLRRGIDGFRIDVVHALAKDEQLRDNPPHPSAHELIKMLGQRAPRQLRVYSENRPEVHPILRDLRSVFEEFGAVAVGEVYLLDIDELVKYMGTGDDQLHLAFNFVFLHSPWDASSFRFIVERTEATFAPINAWPTWALSNHDNIRHATRYGDAAVKSAALLLLTLRGTPFLYYGEELGTPDIDAISHEDLVGRDPARAPMRWDGSFNGGFTNGDPWLPLPPRNYNVADQGTDPNSALSFYRRLLSLRRDYPALRNGTYATVPATHPVFQWRRGNHLEVAINMGIEPTTVRIKGSVLAATQPGREGERLNGTSIPLVPGEGLLVLRDG